MDSQPPPREFRGRLRAWLELFRLPNLFTVPGDPVAGFIIAALVAAAEGPAAAPVAFWRIAPAILASMCLYCAGLLSNDYFDLAEDRRDRPERPLPSGRVKAATVFIVACVLAGLGMGAATMGGGMAGAIVSSSLLACLIAYNVVLKRLPVIGPLAMGCCRGLSVLIGSAAAAPQAIGNLYLLGYAIGTMLYIAAVTAVAARETGDRVGWIRMMPPSTMILWVLALIAPVLPLAIATVTPMVLVFLAIGITARCAGGLSGRPSSSFIQATIGRWIRCLLLMQAAAITIIPSQADLGLPLPHFYLPAAILLALWPISAWLGRRFYAS